jgi:hypothetical protein
MPRRLEKGEPEQKVLAAIGPKRAVLATLSKFSDFVLVHQHPGSDPGASGKMVTPRCGM